jgi:hypothetical protein
MRQSNNSELQLIGNISRRILTLALLVVWVAGCSTSFTYSHLDWLIPWYVDDYVDLSRGQRHDLQAQLGPVLQWHKDEELEHYLLILTQLESDLGGQVTSAQVRSWADEIFSAVERVEENMLSVALEFGASLSDEQMAEFSENLRQEQREYEEEFLSRSDQEYVEENKENLEEFIERFTGRLRPEQEAVLLRAAESLHRFDTDWLEDREQWLKTLDPLLQRNPGWQESIKTAYANREDLQSAQYRENMEFNMDVVSQATAEILNQLTAKQRKHVFAELENLRSIIRKLLTKPDFIAGN